ncbi:uncharacterized protein N7482_003620 [Penicillium canariense]|uniref:NYN domain-containing protein n=1 Tax=Penicillium canariense TaxID=189055 RepID=A0A9W9LPB6_9EURO|nr:uncharacterized protein N7482_003620 [Penicillium canariense]KAJ5168026.1 hypothetical protein N7482_003620 [Penicillium canariense]
MLAPEPTEPASNWEFTPVLDLLRSPTCRDISEPAHHAGTKVPSSSYVGQSSQHVASDAARIPEVKRQQSYPKLGDFALIWDLLSQDSTSTRSIVSEHTTDAMPNVTQQPLNDDPCAFTILKRPFHNGYPKTKPTESSELIPASTTSNPRVPKDTTDGSSYLSSRPFAEPVVILKRNITSHSFKSDDKPSHSLPPRTPPRPIGSASHSMESSKAKLKSKAGGKDSKSKVNVEPILSESSTGAESDSSTIIFDRPISKKPGVLAFVPSQVRTPDARGDHDGTPPSSYDEADSTLNSDAVQNIITTSAGIRVLPALYKTATERRIGLMTKLLKDFPEYAQLVSQVGRSPGSIAKNVEPRLIHVFVDMSNVMVGFHDSVKVSRKIPITTRIRRLHMSFSNFALIMERGRVAAKRVLVGSDRLPSIDEAEKLGYEANILDRVHKVKHTTPRPFKFRKPAEVVTRTASGPETVGVSGERWVEQGVDEILHLKMLESIVDTDEPATIVLATGDAAAAEYSGGFMRMVERALQRGWSVELVSFSQVTSYAYRRKEFRTKWGQRFRLLELDAYVEELFD